MPRFDERQAAERTDFYESVASVLCGQLNRDRERGEQYHRSNARQYSGFHGRLCSAKTPYNAEKRGFRGSDAMIDVDELSQVEPVGVLRPARFGE